MKRYIAILTAISLSYLLSTSVWAGDLTIPNSFTSGTPAVASDVNVNFGAVETAVDDNNVRLTALETLVATLQGDLTSANNTIATLQTELTSTNNTIASLQTAMLDKADLGHNHDASYASITHNHDSVYAPISHGHVQADISGLSKTLITYSSQISAINNSEVMALDPYISLTNDSRGPNARFSGLNIQLVNGTGATSGSANGLGNFIIGYDENRTAASSECSLGTDPNTNIPIQDSADCIQAGGVWAINNKSGSHYLVVGAEHNYSRWGGIVAGQRNTSNYDYSSVTGGWANVASGKSSSVSGGTRNQAGRYGDSVQGGDNNKAMGDYASVSGGSDNIANCIGCSVSGGTANHASANHSSVSGGWGNTASGNYSSISGGRNNTASGEYSSISGGGSTSQVNANTASGSYSSVLGGTGQTATGVYQTIPVLP